MVVLNNKFTLFKKKNGFLISFGNRAWIYIPFKYIGPASILIHDGEMLLCCDQFVMEVNLHPKLVLPSFKLN